MTGIIMRVLALASIVALGALLRQKRVFGPQDFHSLSGVLVNVVLPCVVISNFDDFQFGPELMWLALIGFISCGVSTGGGYLLGRRRGEQQMVLHLLNYTGFNIGCFALPFVQNFIGSDAVVSICLFDMGNALIACGGSYALACSLTDRGHTTAPGEFAKRLLASPPLIAYLTMVALNFAGLRLPAFVISVSDIIRDSNTFIAMFLLGLGLKIDGFRLHSRFILRAAGFRLALAAVLALVSYFLLPFSLEVRQGLTLCAFAPVALSCIAYTDMAENDVSAACAWNSTSIIMSFVCMLCVLLVVIY